ENAIVTVTYEMACAAHSCRPTRHRLRSSRSKRLKPSKHYVAAVSMAALVVIAAGALADDSAPQPKRTILDRHDQSEVPGKEIIMGTAELPPGAVISWHTHDGDEIGYVLKGDLVLRT